MGVHQLWALLDDANVKKTLPLQEFEGQTFCVDLSIWIVQAINIVKAAAASGHHVEPRFIVGHVVGRVSHLRAMNIKVVGVLDGSPPAQKKSIADKGTGRKATPNSAFRRWSKNVHICLTALGVPVINLLEENKEERLGSEAEAQCAYMNAIGVADVCVTGDGDAFLFGARRVARNLTLDKSKPMSVDIYDMRDIQDVITRQQMSSDYTSDGVRGWGYKKTLAMLQEPCFSGDTAIQTLKQWHAGQMPDHSDSIVVDGFNIPHYDAWKTSDLKRLATTRLLRTTQIQKARLVENMSVYDINECFCRKHGRWPDVSEGLRGRVQEVLKRGKLKPEKMKQAQKALADTYSHLSVDQFAARVSLFVEPEIAMHSLQELHDLANQQKRPDMTALSSVIDSLKGDDSDGDRIRTTGYYMLILWDLWHEADEQKIPRQFRVNKILKTATQHGERIFVLQVQEEGTESPREIKLPECIVTSQHMGPTVRSMVHSYISSEARAAQDKQEQKEKAEQEKLERKLERDRKREQREAEKQRKQLEKSLKPAVKRGKKVDERSEKKMVEDQYLDLMSWAKQKKHSTTAMASEATHAVDEKADEVVDLTSPKRNLNRDFAESEAGRFIQKESYASPMTATGKRNALLSPTFSSPATPATPHRVHAQERTGKDLSASDIRRPLQLDSPEGRTRHVARDSAKPIRNRLLPVSMQKNADEDRRQA